MLGTPIRLPAARDLYSAGLKIVSTDRYGKADNTDRLGHAPAGIAHAKRGWEPHTAAGGPAGAPVYVSIDDDPSHDQDKQLVATYLRAREPVLGHWRAGRLRELQDHRLRRCRTAPGRTAGSTTSARRGFTHPAAQLHQVEIATREVAGVGEILQPQFGEWY